VQAIDGQPDAKLRGVEILQEARVPPKSLLKNLYARWEYLADQEAFRRAPGLILLRLISWRIRCLLQQAAIIRLPRWGIQMFLPAEVARLAQVDFCFPRILRTRTCHSGRSSLPRKKRLSMRERTWGSTRWRPAGWSARPVASSPFEPSIQSLPALRKNIALNHLTNVVAFPVALSHVTGTAKLYHGPNPSLNSPRQGDCLAGRHRRNYHRNAR